MDEDSTAQLRQMIDDFEAADRSFSEWLDHSADCERVPEWGEIFDNITPVLRLEVQISGFLAEHSWSVVDDPQLVRKARNIREKKDYISFLGERVFLDYLEKKTGKRYEGLLASEDVVETLRNNDDLWDMNLVYEILDEAFWGTPADFLLRKLAIGGLIVRKKIGRQVSEIIGDLRNLYVLGQFRAAVILCRTVLEAALRDKLGRKDGSGKMDSKEVQKLEDWSLPQLWGGSFERNWRYAVYNDKISRINQEATSSVHARTDAASRGCLETIKDTLEILEALYEG